MLRLTILAVALTVVAAAPSFRLSNVFGDHMVLQRETPPTIWGFANGMPAHIPV
jgi:hypothetical protein